MQPHTINGNAKKVIEQEKRILDQTAHKPNGSCEIVLATLDKPNEASLHYFKAFVCQVLVLHFKTPGTDNSKPSETNRRYSDWARMFRAAQYVLRFQ
jgi:hypothetical protein